VTLSMRPALAAVGAFALFGIQSSAFGFDGSVPQETQTMFNEVAAVIATREPAVIDARFSMIASVTGTTDVIRYRRLDGEGLLAELSQCTYSGGRNFDGLFRMLWNCEGRAPTSACYSPNIWMHVMSWSATNMSLGLADEPISTNESCRPAPPQVLRTPAEGRN
jgi:hypothetical protein